MGWLGEGVTGTQQVGGGGGVGGDHAHNYSLQLVELNADITVDVSTL